MTQDIPSDPENRAKSLFSDLIGGRWEKARDEFNASMRVDADRIARGWTTVAESAGRFESMGAPVARQSGSYTVVDIPLTFQAGAAIGRVVVDRDSKVTGLKLEYPRRRRLDPRRVHAFVLRKRNPEVARALHVPG
jgi:Protein of unknown function (DUF3887)